MFVGSGAPKGKELDIPGRAEAAANIHIGIEWLGSVHFGHIEKIGKRVLIIGVGNTAMDCCRTSRRLGGADVKVIARRSRPYFKASPWELEDAEEEGVEIVENHAPKRFVVENGKLVGMEFEQLALDRGERQAEERSDRAPSFSRATTSSSPSARTTRSRGSSATSASTFDKYGHAGRRQGRRWSRRSPACSSAATRRGDRRTSSGPSSTDIRRRSRSTSIARARPLTERPAVRHESRQREDRACTAWSYSNDYNSVAAREDEARGAGRSASQGLGVEVELGFTPSRRRAKCERCLNCDIETHFTAKLCIECDACVDVCPVNCLTITPSAEAEHRLRAAPLGAGDEPDAGHLRRPRRCRRRSA